MSTGCGRATRHRHRSCRQHCRAAALQLLAVCSRPMVPHYPPGHWPPPLPLHEHLVEADGRHRVWRSWCTRCVNAVAACLDHPARLCGRGTAAPAAVTECPFHSGVFLHRWNKRCLIWHSSSCLPCWSACPPRVPLPRCCLPSPPP